MQGLLTRGSQRSRLNWINVPLLLAGLCIASKSVGAKDLTTENQQSKRFERMIGFDGIQDQEIVRVPFDAAVYEHVSAVGHDVRIVNRADDEIPFLMRRQVSNTTRVGRKFWTVRNPQLQPTQDVGLVIHFKLDAQDPQPVGLRIITPLSDFEQTIQLFAVNETGEVPLVVSGVLFDYTKYMNVRRTEINIPTTSAREFRLVISSPTADQQSTFLELTKELQSGLETNRQEAITIERRPFRIDRLELFVEVEEVSATAPVTVEYPLSIRETRQDLERKETQIQLTARKAPLERIEMVTNNKNFSRQAKVLAPDARDKFTQVAGTAQLHRLAFRELQQEQLAISLTASTQYTKLKLVIENRDSPALEVTNVRGFGYVDEAVFFASPNEEYRLIYASGATSLPDYDTAALNAVLAKGASPKLAILGPVVEGTVSREVAPRNIRDIINQPWIIGTVITGLVVILGWGLFRAAKRIDMEA